MRQFPLSTRICPPHLPPVFNPCRPWTILMKFFSLVTPPFLASLCLALLLISCTQTPVQADAKTDTKLDTQFEKQVLEVIRKNPEVVLETLRKYQQQEQLKAQQAQKTGFQKFKTDPKAEIGQSPTYGNG